MKVVAALNEYRQALLSLCLRFGLAALSLLVTVVLTRGLGADQFGLYSFILSFCLLIAGMAQAGSTPLLVREIAVARSRREVIRLGFFALTLVGSITAVLLLAAALLDADRFEQSPSAIVALIGLSSGLALTAAMIRGLHHVLLGQVGDSVLRPTALIVGILVLGSLGARVNANQAFQVYLFSLVAALLFNLALLGVMVRRLSGEREAEPQKTRSILRGFVGLALLGWFTTANAQLPPYIAGYLASPAQAGFYRVAGQFATLLLMGLTAVEIAQGPAYSRAFVMKDTGTLRTLLQTSCRFSTALAIPGGIVLMATAEPIVVVFFGADFRPAADVIRFLALGVMVSALTGNVGTMLVGCRMERALTISAVISLVVLAILCGLLIPSYGAIGAAIAQAASQVVRNGLNGFVAWRALGIVALPRFSLRKKR